MTHSFKYKQCIVVRDDIQMSAGKFAVQVAHASVGAIVDLVAETEDFINFREWFNEGFRKIVLKVNSEKDILDLRQQCFENKIPYFVVTDFGLTELDPNTITCIGIGPGRNEDIDKITGKLKLWR